MFEEEVSRNKIHMAEEVHRQVRMALSKMQQSGVNPNDMVSPSHHRSSCASIGLQDEEIQLTTLEVEDDNQQRYPVDGITQCS